MFETILIIILCLDVFALYYVLNEELLYTSFQKFYKVLFILFFPFVGAIVEIYFISRYTNTSNKKNSDASNDSMSEFYDNS